MESARRNGHRDTFHPNKVKTCEPIIPRIPAFPLPEKLKVWSSNFPFFGEIDYPAWVFVRYELPESMCKRLKWILEPPKTKLCESFVFPILIHIFDQFIYRNKTSNY